MGDVSASFSSELGFVTIARFGNTVMILKWMVADFADQAIDQPSGERSTTECTARSRVGTKRSALATTAS